MCRGEIIRSIGPGDGAEWARLADGWHTLSSEGIEFSPRVWRPLPMWDKEQVRGDPIRPLPELLSSFRLCATTAKYYRLTNSPRATSSSPLKVRRLLFRARIVVGADAVSFKASVRAARINRPTILTTG